MIGAELKKARAAGVSWLCCQCKKFSTAREVGIAGQDCMAAVTAKPCGSPLVGLAFPEYEGEVSDFQRFCFVCGATASQGMRVKGSAKVFGVCAAHGPAWAVQRAPVTARPVLAPEITYNGGTWASLDKVPRKKSLQELMLEFDPQTFDPLPEPEEGK